MDKKAVLRAASEFRVVGRSPARLDAVDKVTGAAKYTADLRIPGMLYARLLLRPPAHGARLVTLDSSGAEAVPGTRVVREGNLTAVLHADPEAAAMALGRLRADWQWPPARLDTGNIFDHIVKHVADQKSIVDRGNLPAARANAARLFETRYRKGYVAHAPIETHTALAEVRDGSATVWASTQTPFPTRDLIAQTLGPSQKSVRVMTPFVGGGFGVACSIDAGTCVATLAEVQADRSTGKVRVLRIACARTWASS